MLLSLKGVNVYYGGIHAIKGIDIEVQEGSFVTLIGANGAGKTTTLKAIVGLVPVQRGSISFSGADITNAPTHEIVRMGIVLVPEGRRVFANLTVEENLIMGGFFLDDAECVFISYGSAARSALHVVENRRARGEHLGLLELQTLWPFPAEYVRERCEHAEYIIVIEMNMGQILQEVKKAVDDPEKVFLANSIDGTFITPTKIRNILRVIQGKGV